MGKPQRSETRQFVGPCLSSTGSLAVSSAGDPSALRPRLTTGLPLSATSSVGVSRAGHMRYLCRRTYPLLPVPSGPLSHSSDGRLGHTGRFLDSYRRQTKRLRAWRWVIRPLILAGPLDKWPGLLWNSVLSGSGEVPGHESESC